MTWEDGEPQSAASSRQKLETLLGPARGREPAEPRHDALAASLQRVEEAVFDVSQRAPDADGLTRLCLAGGCAMNCVANGKIFRDATSGASSSSPPRATTAPRSARRSTSGISAGGAARFVMRHGYWGPAFDDGDDRGGDRRAARRSTRLHAADRRRRSSCATGPRRDRRRPGRRLVPGPHGVGPARARQPQHPGRSAARGHEGHPQPTIKLRETFRPFAPSVLRRRSSEYFDGRRPRPVHDSGLSRPAGKARASSPPSRTSTDRAGCRPSSRDTNPATGR